MYGFGALFYLVSLVQVWMSLWSITLEFLPEKEKKASRGEFNLPGLSDKLIQDVQ